MIDVENLKVVQNSHYIKNKRLIDVKLSENHMAVFFEDNYVMLLVANDGSVAIDNAPSEAVRAMVKNIAAHSNYLAQPVQQASAQ